MEDAIKNKKHTKARSTNFYSQRASGPNSFIQNQANRSKMIEKSSIKAETAEEKTNKILKAKLIQFEHQNNLNVEKAKLEIEKIKDDIKKSEENNRKLVLELEIATKKLQQLVAENCKNNQNYENLQIIDTEKAQKYERALNFYNANIALRFMANFRKVPKILKKERTVEKLRFNRLLSKSLELLKRNVLISKLTKFRTEVRNKTLLHNSIVGLLKNTAYEKKLKQIIKIHELDLQKKTINAFIKYPQIIAIHQKNLQNSINQYEINLKRKTIISLIKYHEKYILDPEKEDELLEKALNYYVKGMAIKTFNSLNKNIEIHKPLKQKLQNANQNYLSKMLKKGFIGLKYLFLIKRMQDKKLSYYQILKIKRIVRKSIMALRINLRENRKKKILGIMAYKAQIKRYMQYWKQAYEKIFTDKKRENALSEYYNTKIMRRAWRGININLINKKRDLALIKSLKIKKLIKLRELTFNKWKKLYRKISIFRKLSNLHKNRILAKIFRNWLFLHSVKQAQKIKTRFAITFNKKTYKKHIRNILQNWLTLALKKNLLKHKLSQSVQKISKLRKNQYLNNWISQFTLKISGIMKNELKQNYEQIMVKSAVGEQTQKHLEEECKKYEEELGKIREESLKLENELSNKENLLSQKEAELHEKQEACKDLDKIMDLRDNELLDLQQQKEKILDNFESQRKEYENSIKIFKSENEELTSKIQILEQELRSKHEELQNAEKELMQLHGTSKTKDNSADYFKQLDDVTENNKKLMISLENKKKEILNLEQKLKSLIEEGNLLGDDLLNIREKQENVIKSKEDRLIHLDQMVFLLIKCNRINDYIPMQKY